MDTDLSLKTVLEAARRLSGTARRTPLQFNPRLSKEAGARVYLKREDLQEVRSYKIRGAYNLMAMLSDEERGRGVVCASAGNHAQGVALGCVLLGVRGTVFMPQTTPLQKIARVKHFGDGLVAIRLFGANYDESCAAAIAFAAQSGAVFVHPFDDCRVMSGQGTVGKEIFEDAPEKIDAVLCPVGGGGLVAGVGTYLKAMSPGTKIFGIEPAGAAGMKASFMHDRVVGLENLDAFVDGAAVRTVGKKTFVVARRVVDRLATVSENDVCVAMIDLYQHDGIVAEPAGALSVAALSRLHDELVGKTVVCVLSGGNNDLTRYPEIIARAALCRTATR